MKSKIITFSLMLSALLQHQVSTAQANKKLSNLVAPVAVNQSLLPGTDSTLDLGSKDKSWLNLYLAGKLFLADSLTLYADAAKANFFSGTNAGLSVSSGKNNTGIGFNALREVSSGYGNTATGADAMRFNIGSYNVALGNSSLRLNYTGSFNSATGFNSMYNNYNGNFNTANGSYALYSNTDGTDNTATAYSSLYSNTTGNANTAYGSSALTFNTTGSSNTATGRGALFYNATGDLNTAAGDFTMLNNTSGNKNTANGAEALYNNTTGNGNTAIGYGSFKKNTTGNRNTLVGFNADANDDHYSNATAIGNKSQVTASNQVRIGNVNINSIGGFTSWSNMSDGRIKKNVKENVPGLLFINKLHPVTYNLNIDAVEKITQADKNDLDEKSNQQQQAERSAKEKITYTGFIAQDVEKIAKEINYNFSGIDAAKNNKDLYALRYAEFVVPLVKAVQELSKENEELKCRLEKLEKKHDRTFADGLSKSIEMNGSLLDQNVPNPANNTTDIGYTLPQKFITAKIIINDSNGKALKELAVSGAGKGTLKLNTTMLSAGTYNYSLLVDGALAGSRQMVIVK